ncbi:MAG TPA: hypothetical protein ENF39_01635 [Candidatus Aenigmarchaeota archaeon]|nr:hypothetical protein [Candidatus Aenigmarchaeota archaeon]
MEKKIDVNSYKIDMIREITGYNPDGSKEILVVSSWGMDVINQIRDILRKDYKSMGELSDDIEKLKSDVLAYSLFD